MSVVVKISNQGNIDSHSVQLFANMGNRRCGLRSIDSQPDQFGASQRQFLDLDGCAYDIDRVGVGHRLDPHRRIATDCDASSSPGHTGLPAATCFGRRRGNRHKPFHYFTSKRATLSRATDNKSKAWPRTRTCVVSDRPTTTMSGKAPETPTVSPAAILRRT